MMKKSFFGFSLLVFIIILISFGFSEASESDTSVAAQLKAMEHYFNPKLPIGSDASKLIQVYSGPGRQFNYLSVTNISVARWTPKMRAQSAYMAINGYCTDPGMSRFREMEVTVVWRAYDEQGNFIYDNRAAPKDCRK